ncbi:MAG: transcriptional regulator, AraC family, partial [Paenibacillus sp.]|nr:transcriptional regulator, AraC family [Paenibacillus sp.]
LKELELGDEAPKVVFAIIEIDKYVQFSLMYNQRDQSLYKYWIEKGLHEISYDPFIKMWSEWMAGNQLGVMFILQDQAAAHARIHDICDSFRMWVNKHTRFTVTVGIGSCFEEISSLPSSYEEASSALNYKSVLGDNRIIEYFQIHPGSKDELVTYLQNIRVMSQLFKSGNPVWENHFEQVFNGLKVALLAQKDIINVLNYMMLYINREINSLPLSFREIWADSMMPQCLDILDRYETLADIQHNLKTKLDEMYSQFKGLRRVRSNYSLIEDVKYYLEQRYSDASLSLVSVSENFSINSSFLSRIFKEETGENFVDFLARIRIRHAELKLSETKMSVQEIARQVGYNNSLSFIRVFKKIVGHTPGDYRKTFK